jgi:hypothetical protein
VGGKLFTHRILKDIQIARILRIDKEGYCWERRVIVLYLELMEFFEIWSSYSTNNQNMKGGLLFKYV